MLQLISRNFPILSLMVLMPAAIAMPVCGQPDPSPEQIKDQKPEPPAQRSYTGIGGTLGLSGKTTALGTGGLAILSKRVLTDLLSIHGNMVVFGSATTSSTNALTFNFPIRDQATQEIMVSPFFGGGIMIRNDGTFYVDPAVVGGLDLPIGQSFTGTVRIEAGFPNTGKPDVGLSVGVGYNF